MQKVNGNVTPSLVTPTVPVEPAQDVNPFRYGWRYVKVTQPDGTEVLDQIPLTLEDVLHPQEDDVIPENNVHEAERGDLARIFRIRLPGGLILSDCIIDWGVPGVRNHSPDVSVFDQLQQQPPEVFGTFHLAATKGRCLMAMELVSPDTRVNDVVRKLEEFHQVGIPLYIIVDQKKLGGPRTLLAYRHASAGYERIPLDDQGRIFLEPLGIYLGLVNNRVVCFDAKTGEIIGDYTQVSQALAQEKQAREEVEKRLRELEEEVKRLKGP